MRRVWDKQKDKMLRRNYPDGHLASLAAVIGVSLPALKSRASVLGLRRKVNKRYPWTKRQLSFLRRHYATMSAAEIAPEVRKSVTCVYQKARMLGLEKSPGFMRERGRRNSQHPNSVAHRFVKGQVPPNKGKRIVEFMSDDGIARSSRTRFSKGHRPHNVRDIGTELLRNDGYVWVKTAGGLKMKQRWVWEQAHGPIPKGKIIRFRDGDATNCALDNLTLVSRAENLRVIREAMSPEARASMERKRNDTRNDRIRKSRMRLRWGFEPIYDFIKHF